MTITQHQAEAAINAARRAAEQIGVPMNIAILDAGVHVKAFARMDGALLGSIDIALGKAKTAALFAMRSDEIGEFCKPGGPSPGLENSNGGLVVFAGGVPLVSAEGTLVGAIGVSGGAVTQDKAVAEAAADAVRALHR